ncbi:hypothetical protein [Flavobacterium sp.]|uniref:hypothetical protein n=1 Tax=Flavobacterium sp. TaxID=239 RepID=UPI0025DDF308|nr:hypothetical protein [Flavobacterium sp.]
MKRTLFIILLLSFKSYSQDFIGTWNVISYEDEIVYYNKTTDSISYKIPARKAEAERFKQMSELIIFSVTYSFEKEGKYVENHPAIREVINGSFEVDKRNKIILIIDDEGKKDKLSYDYTDGILFVRMKMKTGFIKLGLTKVSN